VFKTILITKKCPLWPYLALYVQFSWCALFTKAMPTNLSIRHDFNCHINEKETPKTCLTNYKGSISHHITPLVINSLGGGHTHIHTHASILTSRTKAISRNQLHTGLQPAHTWFNICQVGLRLLCSKIHLLFFLALFKIFTYYSLQYHLLFPKLFC